MLSLILVFILSGLAQEKQYPEDRSYRSDERGFAQYAARSAYNTSTYALTFDDGPHVTHTPRLLDILKKYQVKATFFIITERLSAATRPIVKRMIEEGHIVANHGEKHHNSNQITETEFKKNLEIAQLKLHALYDESGVDFQQLFYRFPYAAYGANSAYHHMNAMQSLSQALYGDNCLQFAFWDVDSNDWVADMTSEDIFQSLKAHELGGRAFTFESYRNASGKLLYRKKAYTVTNPPRGGVILQHDIHEKTLKGTELFLEFAKNNGVKIVELNELDEYRVLRQCSLKSSVF